MKVRIGGEARSADLRRRGGLKGGETLLEARGAILRRRVETQDGGEGSSMDDALPRVTTRLKTQRPDVQSPDAGQRHASGCALVATSFRYATPDATPNANQNTALHTAVATRNWLCNSAGANDDSTTG